MCVIIKEVKRVLLSNLIIGKVQLVLLGKVAALDHVGLDEHAVIGATLEILDAANGSVILAKGLVELNTNPKLIRLEFGFFDEVVKMSENYTLRILFLMCSNRVYFS